MYFVHFLFIVKISVSYIIFVHMSMHPSGDHHICSRHLFFSFYFNPPPLPPSTILYVRQHVRDISSFNPSNIYLVNFCEPCLQKFLAFLHFDLLCPTLTLGFNSLITPCGFIPHYHCDRCRLQGCWQILTL